jgi:hypothetical protein
LKSPFPPDEILEIFLEQHLLTQKHTKKIVSAQSLKVWPVKINHIANYLILLQTLYNATPAFSGFIALLNQQNKMV